jgi:hypothetical protein
MEKINREDLVSPFLSREEEDVVFFERGKGYMVRMVGAGDTVCGPLSLPIVSYALVPFTYQLVLPFSPCLMSHGQIFRSNFSTDLVV